MTFKIGDRVVVNPNCTLTGGGIFHPNVLYTILDTAIDDYSGYQSVKLAEYLDMGWWSHERFALSAEPKTKPHKWAKEIKAWADCPQLVFQFRGAACQSNCWYDMPTPDWSHSEIRLKPEKKPDLVVTRKLTKNSDGLAIFPVGNASWLPELGNLKLTFDGETGMLKSVEIIK